MSGKRLDEIEREHYDYRARVSWWDEAKITVGLPVLLVGFALCLGVVVYGLVALFR